MSDYQGKRFKEFLHLKHITVVDAAKQLNVSRQNLYQYFRSDTLSRETVNKMLKAFKASEQEIFGFAQEPDNGKPMGEVHYPIDSNETPFVDIGGGQYLMIIPLVNEYAYAGYLAGFKDSEYLEDLPKHTIVVQKQHRGHYRSFEVIGESMENPDLPRESIYDGSIVTGREVQPHLWRSRLHTHRWKDFVIVHKEGILIKRISNQNVDDGLIELESLNANKDQFPNRTVHLDDVDQIYNIVNVTQFR
jgi:transcriptional regulator with XRE-family HTH domain